MGVVVVGVDGSKGAQAALEWAAGEAQRREDALRVVFAEPPLLTPAHVAFRAGGAVGPTSEERLEVGEKLLDEALQAVGYDGPAEREVLLDVSPAKALVDQSQGADLLVVGSRGLGGFRGLLVGSVSLQCVSHAACPVVVVPHRAD